MLGRWDVLHGDNQLPLVLVETSNICPNLQRGENYQALQRSHGTHSDSLVSSTSRLGQGLGFSKMWLSWHIFESLPANSPQRTSAAQLLWELPLAQSPDKEREARLKADLPFFTTAALLSASGVFTPHTFDLAKPFGNAQLRSPHPSARQGLYPNSARQGRLWAARAHLAMQGQELLQVALEVPGTQGNLHLPQERVAAEAVVVPHRELQRPREQEGLVNLILGREKTTGEGSRGQGQAWQIPSATAPEHERRQVRKQWMHTGACFSFIPCLPTPQTARAAVQEPVLSQQAAPGARTHGIWPSHHQQSSAKPPSLRWSEHRPQQTWLCEPENQTAALASSCARVPGLRGALLHSGTESASRDGKGQCQVVLPWGPELISVPCPPSCHCNTPPGARKTPPWKEISRMPQEPRTCPVTQPHLQLCLHPTVALGPGSTARAEQGFCSFQGAVSGHGSSAETLLQGWELSPPLACCSSIPWVPAGQPSPTDLQQLVVQGIDGIAFDGCLALPLPGFVGQEVGLHIPEGRTGSTSSRPLQS